MQVNEIRKLYREMTSLSKPHTKNHHFLVHHYKIYK